MLLSFDIKVDKMQTVKLSKKQENKKINTRILQAYSGGENAFQGPALWL